MTHSCVHRVEASEANRYLDALADVLIDCVEGGASVSFMLPISREKARGFWSGVLASVGRGERTVLVALDGDAVVGTVQLITALPENQPHRAEIAKMLVRRSARRRGIAQILMGAAEQEARRAGKSLLVLDAVTGSHAERLYERAGFMRAGVVPNYALMPDGAFCSTTIFYKPL